VLQGRRRETHADVIVGSVQTAVRAGALGLLAQRGLGLVVVDETHHIAAPSYQTILKGVRVFEPDGPRLLGVTATLGRADGLALGDTFDGPPAMGSPGHVRIYDAATNELVDSLDLGIAAGPNHSLTIAKAERAKRQASGEAEPTYQQMTIDGVKFRRPVTPGDTLVFDVEVLQFRRGVCKLRGRALVEGHIAAEAELMASVVDR